MTHSQPQILLHQIDYSITTDKPLFTALSLSLDAEKKVGLVGRNGMGKSTLFKLIMGELSPQAGSIQVNGTLAYCPQTGCAPASATVADMLGVREKLDALARILGGSISEKDFQIVGDDWMLTEHLHQQLNAFNLAFLSLDHPIQDLSGGEKTRLRLAKAFLANADWMLLDEPTNNLDASARKHLYELIAAWDKGLLIISHDRTLLNGMDQIIELTSLGVKSYGGNYDHYLEQKTLMQEAAQHDLLAAKISLDKSRQSIQLTRERSEQKRSQGRKLFTTGKIDKLFANSQKGRCERTQSRHVKQNENMLGNAEKKLDEAKANIEITPEIQVSLPKTYVPSGKMLVEMEELTFAHANTHPIIQQFNLLIAGPERIAFAGCNGSGKTTLVKLMLGKLMPLSGKLHVGTTRVSYLDQQAMTLHPDLSILDNFLLLNPDARLNDAYAALATFLFRNTATHQLVNQLSGGEKLRAELACALMSTNPPQLLILDEPTNHLDLDSITSIESALNQYQGAMIVISHDQSFLDRINITRFIHAPFIRK